MIGQPSQNKYHNHDITDPGHNHPTRNAALVNMNDYLGEGGTRWTRANGGNTTTDSRKTGISINYNGDENNQEARSENFTYKIWLRIN